MHTYLAEAYLSRDGYDDLPEAIARMRRAAADLTSDGHHVRYVRTIFVPEDETCFHLFEGVSVRAVEKASRRAGLSFNRIAEAVGRELEEETVPTEERKEDS
jgi:hypothetical protein